MKNANNPRPYFLVFWGMGGGGGAGGGGAAVARVCPSFPRMQ